MKISAVTIEFSNYPHTERHKIATSLADTSSDILAVEYVKVSRSRPHILGHTQAGKCDIVLVAPGRAGIATSNLISRVSTIIQPSSRLYLSVVLEEGSRADLGRWYVESWERSYRKSSDLTVLALSLVDDIGYLENFGHSSPLPAEPWSQRLANLNNHRYDDERGRFELQPGVLGGGEPTLAPAHPEEAPSSLAMFKELCPPASYIIVKPSGILTTQEINGYTLTWAHKKGERIIPARVSGQTLTYKLSAQQVEDVPLVFSASSMITNINALIPDPDGYLVADTTSKLGKYYGTLTLEGRVWPVDQRLLASMHSSARGQSVEYFSKEQRIINIDPTLALILLESDKWPRYIFHIDGAPALTTGEDFYCIGVSYEISKGFLKTSIKLMQANTLAGSSVRFVDAKLAPSFQDQPVEQAFTLFSSITFGQISHVLVKKFEG